MPALVEQHKGSIAERKKECQVLRREEKAKRREVHIEICSEVIDLILDLSNEAWDESKKNGKIGKPIWRDWMRWFKDNKLVSRARRGLLGQEQETFVVAEKVEEQLDALEDPKRPIDEVLETIRGEQTYADLLEYLSVAGIFNLTDGRFEEWEEIRAFVKPQRGLHFDFDHLTQRYPPSNPQIGSTIFSILNQSKQEATASLAKIEEEKKEGAPPPLPPIPHYLSVKLCILGKACSGKRTISK